MTDARKEMRRRWATAFFSRKHVTVHALRQSGEAAPVARRSRWSWHLLSPIARWLLTTKRRWPSLHAYASVHPRSPDPDRLCPTLDRSIYAILEASECADDMR
ncbi:hypothetical protein SPRG_15595 [Saprolegnia parasitica CBS 223.65]|uniref:Uncharacterized protein n=1 Tax=Saprolegnia parasitica (strain CBS 223.65) TaxID=695850 RepID=A0A067BEK3_SAPPC|nr:hypothetical protein SPRG_15595 [Saprolegnia parasitica CBS 223.65]KDO16804.1 hypothetical protein SPRG_15595 [Saprolegnia parasitica CBS 223.65]|eukprot:XP_012212489.1 hypothetical protein SPRG_15595 [Saprolegnia parasitica CBS 223.65]